jgi:hypothetical protein
VLIKFVGDSDATSVTIVHRGWERLGHRGTGGGTRGKPWVLKTPSGGSEFQMYRDPDADPPALVCTVGKTELRYHLNCLDDLHAMLKAHGDWMPLGNADEQKPAAEGTVEAWRDPPTTRSAGGRG